MENSIMSYEDLLREKVAGVPTEKLVLSLFSVAEDLVGTELTLNEIFQEAVQNFSITFFGQIIDPNKFKIVCQNVCYKVGFFLRHSQTITYTDFIKAVNGYTVKIIKDSEQYFYDTLDDVCVRINECRKLIPEKDISYKYYRGFLNSIEKTINICRKNIFVELFDLTFCEEFMHSKPILVNSLSGDIAQIIDCIQAVKNELIILQSFSTKERNLVYSAYNMNSKEENLYDKVMSQYLLGSLYSDGIYIDKVDAQLLLSEMKNKNDILENELLEIIEKLKINNDDALSYLKHYLTVLTRRINLYKKTAYFSELFTIIEKSID